MKIDINVPNGKSGIWEVKDLIINNNITSVNRFNDYRTIPNGKYKKLTREGKVIMANTPDEIEDFMPFVQRAHGDILINGLGLGTIIVALLTKDNINSITVIENSQDVIKLVATTYLDDKRVTIILDDAFTRSVGNKESYDFIWHDIWDTIDPNNISEMNILKEKYKKIAYYQECWAEQDCKKMISKEMI